jgi:hypothetical protein
LARFWKETSASTSRAARATASITGSGAGQRFAAFIGIVPSRIGNCALTIRQYDSSGPAPGASESSRGGRLSTRGSAGRIATPA